MEVVLISLWIWSMALLSSAYTHYRKAPELGLLLPESYAEVNVDAASQKTNNKKIRTFKKILKKTNLISCKLPRNNRLKLVNYLSVKVQKNKITMERIFTFKSRQTLCCGFKREGRKCWFGPFWSLKACKSVIISFPSLAWERLSWSDSHFKEFRINRAWLSSVFLWSKQDSTNWGRLLFRVDQIFHQPQSQQNKYSRAQLLSYPSQNHSLVKLW